MRNILRALVHADGESGLFGRAMSAGFWAAGLRVTLRVSMILRTLVIARLLAPEDYGLMTIATLSILLLDRFTQAGFEQALVQSDKDIKPYLNTAWTMQLVRGVVMTAILAASAPLIAAFFDAPEATNVVRIAALSVLLKGFTNISVVTFVKELRFDKYFVIQMAGKGVDVVASIIAAFALRNVWALVIGVVAGAFGQLIASYVIDAFRPRLAWIWAQVKELFDFGKWVLATQILSYGAGELDDILVGRILGVQSLGWYRMAFNLSQAVATEVTQVTNQVAFPTYSKLQNARDKLEKAYLGTMHLVAFIGFPLALGTILVAPDLTYGLLGDKWAPIIEPLRLLSVAGLVRGVAATSGPIFLSQGRPELQTRYRLAKLVMMIVLLVPAINAFDISGAALVIVITGTLTGIAAIRKASGIVGVGARAVLGMLGYPAINTAVMTAAVLVTRLMFFDGYSVVSLFVLVAVGIATYLASVFLTTRLFGYKSPSDLLARVRKAAL